MPYNHVTLYCDLRTVQLTRSSSWVLHFMSNQDFFGKYFKFRYLGHFWGWIIRALKDILPSVSYSSNKFLFIGYSGFLSCRASFLSEVWMHCSFLLEKAITKKQASSFMMRWHLLDSTINCIFVAWAFCYTYESEVQRSRQQHSWTAGNSNFAFRLANRPPCPQHQLGLSNNGTMAKIIQSSSPAWDENSSTQARRHLAVVAVCPHV